MLRRKHWLLVSLSCSALLLLLVLGGARTPLSSRPVANRYQEFNSEALRSVSSDASSVRNVYASQQSTEAASSAREVMSQVSSSVGVSSEGGAAAPADARVINTSYRNSTLLEGDETKYSSDDGWKPTEKNNTNTTDGQQISVSFEGEIKNVSLDVRKSVHPKTRLNFTSTINAEKSTTRDQTIALSSGSMFELTITDINSSPKDDEGTPPPQHKRNKDKAKEKKGPSRSASKGNSLLDDQYMARAYPQLIKAGVSAAKYRVSREYQMFPGDINFKPGSPVPKSQMKRILILTTWRSGSTFLGDIFNAYPGTFYSFEPLHQLLQKQHFQDGSLKPEIMKLLKNIMNCDMESQQSYLDYTENNTFLMSHNSRYWQSCSINRAICYDPTFYNEVCEIMPVNVIKTVRLGGEPVEELLQDLSLDLRVIHLVRDPRGTLHSRLRLDWCRAPVCSEPEVVCKDLMIDLGHAQRLQTKYPDRFLLVRYEDLGTQPDEMANLILDFVGLSYTDSVRKYVAEHTKLTEKKPVVRKVFKVPPGRGRNRKPKNAYSTFRDSRTTTFAWRSHFNFSSVAKIQSVCADPIRWLNFRIFSNEKEYKNGNLSVLLPETQS